MPLILRDSINAPLIPRDTPVVAGYGDGRFIWSPSWLDGSNWWDLFPNAVQLVIVVDAAHSGDVLDVEMGDASPADVPGWCDRFHRPGRRAPTVYCNRSTWPLVRQAAGARRVDYWIGTLDGTTDVPGAVAVQYVDTGTYDESVIHDPTWVGFRSSPLTGGNDMAAAPRPDGSAIDYFVVRTNATVDHYVFTFANGMGAAENLAGGILPHTLSACWVGSELVVFGQAPDGSVWQNIFNTAWSGWAPTGVRGALPAPGPAGPAGPATYVRHTHGATTDAGTPQ